MRRRLPRPASLPQRVGVAVLVTVIGVGAVSLVLEGSSSNQLLRVLQGLSLFGLGTVVVMGVVSLVVVRLGGWRDPEATFEQVVQRSERLARFEDIDGDILDFSLSDAEPEDDDEELELADPDEEFDRLVREAVEELPLEFHRALEHVAIVVSDSGSVAIRGRDGRRRGAYGMYQGDTVSQDFFTERILIFRDTLTRDFGHDPELLGRQVRRVLRHELAHHLGWGERGVRNLGL